MTRNEMAEVYVIETFESDYRARDAFLAGFDAGFNKRGQLDWELAALYSIKDPEKLITIKEAILIITGSIAYKIAELDEEKDGN